MSIMTNTFSAPATLSVLAPDPDPDPYPHFSFCTPPRVKLTNGYISFFVNPIAFSPDGNREILKNFFGCKVLISVVACTSVFGWILQCTLVTHC